MPLVAGARVLLLLMAVLPLLAGAPVRQLLLLAVGARVRQLQLLLLPRLPVLAAGPLGPTPPAAQRGRDHQQHQVQAALQRQLLARPPLLHHLLLLAPHLLGVLLLLVPAPAAATV